ncbi:MBL fold hydrolase [Mycolicibacterium agri]|uniref:MBL fold hydrolase n=1 Tax=Mycolicibacterium agri TaxID=36811 RepID=A0A7I9WE08_MYCAG|nr:MBL fold hydrolase [Mycolicibacterium agri]
MGRLGDPSSVRRLQLDGVVATYVVDAVLRMDVGFFPTIPRDFWSANRALLGADGRLPMSAGGLLVELAGTTVLIDAGVGPGPVQFPDADIRSGALVDVLADIGRRPEDVDVVAFTHLHFDHSGWAFVDGEKTFPHARYVLAASEWIAHASCLGGDGAAAPEHVLRAFASGAAELDLVGDGDEVVAGVRAIVTPGHSPGHTSYVITSQSGHRLVAFGDVFHAPAQLAHPDWVAIADRDTAGVIAARRRLLAELSAPNTVGFGFHFGDQAFGRVVTSRGSEALWEPVPTWVLAPAPQQSQ